jgi:hypothetical protein
MRDHKHICPGCNKVEIDCDLICCENCNVMEVMVGNMESHVRGMREAFGLPPAVATLTGERHPSRTGTWRTYRDDADPIKRAIYWLSDLSWRCPDEFEVLQGLAAELGRAASRPGHP